MAEIHLAKARGIEGFEKLVVVKQLLPHKEHDPSLVAMFLDEARVAATLHHPNVVQVYDIGVAEDDDYYFTMEFVNGQDLSHLLRRAATMRKPPTLDQALTIVIGLCAGLHYAHEKEGPDGKPLNLVHRDVSPQNVLISYDGAVKIMDFGIAKATNSSQETRDGTLKGKIAYMSPEQGRSSTLDRRSDVFSLAIMLWELTTFKRLFKADSDFETLRRIITEDAPKPSRVRPSYPPALERIVMKGLSRDPDERYQTAQEMQLDLEAFARERKLVVSSVSLSKYIRELFHDRVDAWARAQAEGKSFADFLVESPMGQEGSVITADTWIAPGTEPTNTGMPAADLEEPEISVGDDAEPAPLRNKRWLVAALAVLGLGGIGLFALHGSGGTSDQAAATGTASEGVPAAHAPDKPTDPQPTEPTAAEPPTTGPTATARPKTEPTAAATEEPATDPTAAATEKPTTEDPPSHPIRHAKRPPKRVVKPAEAPKEPKPKKHKVDLDSPFPD